LSQFNRSVSGAIAAICLFCRRVFIADKRLQLLLPLLVCLLLLTPVAFAADITLSDTCSLANAIRSANGDTQVAPANQCAAGDSAETDTIIFVADVEITAALPAIASDIRIVGNDKSLTPPDTSENSETEYNFNLLTLNSGAVRIENLHLADVDDSALKIEKTGNSDLEVLYNLGSIGHNIAATHGGAIHISGGAVVEIHTSRIGHNGAPNGNGGAIYVDDSTLTVKWSNLHDNDATGNGGAIYFANDSGDEHSLTVTGGRLTRNSATDDDASTSTDENGGAIYYENGTSTDGAISSLANNSVHANTARNGGSIYVADGKLTVDNSTFDENRASDQGGAIYAAGGHLTVRHATIVKNQAATGGGIGAFSDDDENTTDPELYVYNSIIAQNTDTDTENSVCLIDLLSGNAGNILQDVGCTEAQSVSAPLRIELVPFTGETLPRSVLNRFYRLLDGSPAIDNGVNTPGQMLANDQTGHTRPEGDGYDSGAFEFDVEEVWVIPSADTRNSEQPVDSTPSPSTTIFHTCVDVHERDNGITIQATFGLRSGVQCQEIDATGIGIQSLIDAGFSNAVDIWGYVEQGVQVCFDGAGPVLFLEAATVPRTIHAIDSFVIGAKTCTSIWGAGSLVLQTQQASGGAWPAATAQPLAVAGPTPSPQCLGSITDAVNVRDAPNGRRIGGIFPGETVTVLDRDGGWHRLNYLGLIGWVSAQYVSLSGECSFAAA